MYLSLCIFIYLFLFFSSFLLTPRLLPFSFFTPPLHLLYSPLCSLLNLPSFHPSSLASFLYLSTSSCTPAFANTSPCFPYKQTLPSAFVHQKTKLFKPNAAEVQFFLTVCFGSSPPPPPPFFLPSFPCDLSCPPVCFQSSAADEAIKER